MPRGPGVTREPLSRERVLRAAVALADTEGLDAVSMRRLADSLGVVPMALYKHVSDKDDLLDGMVAIVIGDIPVAGAGASRRWRAAVRETILGARTVVLAHPWARRAIETRTLRTPAVLGHMERLTQLFLGAGFSADLTHHVMHLLGNRIWGFSPELFNETPGKPEPVKRRTSGEPDPQDYPGIMLIAADARARRPDATGCDEDFEFDFALDVILDGIARLHRSKWDSTTRTVRD
ncbi:TetR/AcrR family transcriptional regulator [Humibacillus xanthopallidus]|uniref:TetR family transcriptional regulator n=1 Tax=Humibacillus xanthopallidus TaxID=412689 RepID=A0A543HA46_9MICO|nr:TetR/AcrR family transcriptional regulator [Humibacillus xanthopallidus]TQM55201.1 TetR family transcriptional regulator [Humibacillus xanthopallidus]